MKLRLAVVFLSLSVFAVSVGYANEAPIERIPTGNVSATPGDQVPTDNMASETSKTVDPVAHAAMSTATVIAPLSDHLPLDAGQSNHSIVVSDSDDHLVRVEQQVANIASMNLPQQIDELRQEVQQLNGRLQVQQHDIKLLSQQQKAFYQDLNRRLSVSSGSTDHVLADPASPTAGNVTVADSNLPDSAAVYRRAFGLLLKKQYDDAAQGFMQYLHQYPKGDLAVNAYYWIGELYLKQNKPALAQDAFNSVLQKYPGSNKVPDAKLKLALILVSQGKKSQARSALLAIKRQYPDSTAAQLSGIQLQRLEQ